MYYLCYKLKVLKLKSYVSIILNCKLIIYNL